MPESGNKAFASLVSQSGSKSAVLSALSSQQSREGLSHCPSKLHLLPMPFSHYAGLTTEFSLRRETLLRLYLTL